MGKAIGIDLGTTNSCCAYVLNGKPQVVTYRDGSRTIPSVFAIDKNGNRLVGNEARSQAVQNPNHTIAASKRLIGRSFGSNDIQRMQQVFTYDLVEGESSEVLIRVSDQVFTLEQISAAILRRIKESAEEALGDEVDQAVITVPAYFNDRQRQAVRSAGKLAGLKVLRVLNEPTAAALAYGLGRTLNQRVAIYDLGGGTFDISIIDIKDKIFEVIATGGDTFLGGVDFDDRLMQWVLQSFADETDIDVSYDRAAVTRIREASEAAKIRLSEVDSTDISLPEICVDDDGRVVHLHMTVTRAMLEQLTEDLIDRSIATVDRILQEAGTHPDKIDEMLLVGGQSRMPLVRNKLQSFIGRPPSNKVHPDEAVAIGAAIMAHSLSSKAGPQDMTLLDVLPMAIGINKVDGSMHELFAKNQPLPDYKTRVLTTNKDNQRSIMLRIYQGESKYVRENELLGTFVFSGLREAPKGSVRIEVTFHIDSEGILNLTARDIDTGHLVESRLKLGKEGGPGQRRRRRPPGPSRPAGPPKPPSPSAPPPSLHMPRKSSLASSAPAAGALPPRPAGPATVPPPVMHQTADDDVDLLDMDLEDAPPSGGRSFADGGGAPYWQQQVEYEEDELPERREPRGLFEWLLSLFGLLD